jgi:hypothetical protein
MRYFHLQRNHFWKPVVNLDKLWSLVPAESRDKYLNKQAGDVAPVIDLLSLGYSKVLGKGRCVHSENLWKREHVETNFFLIDSHPSQSSSRPVTSRSWRRRRSRRLAVPSSWLLKCNINSKTVPFSYLSSCLILWVLYTGIPSSFLSSLGELSWE